MPVDPRLAALDERDADTPETPEVKTEAPAEDTPTSPAAVIDFEDRYNNLRPEFDRTKQQLAEEREQRLQYEAQLEQLRQQPVYDEDDEDDEYVDQAARQHILRLEAQLAEQREKETRETQKQQEYSHIDAELDSIESETGDELSDEEARMLGNYALANRDEHGRPDVRLAYQTFNKVFEQRKAGWVDTKKSAPGAPASGPGAVAVTDLDDPEQVADYIDRAMGFYDQ